MTTIASPRPASPRSAGDAILYGRVSGAHDPRTASLESQIDACLARAREDGYAVAEDDIFTERFTGVDSSHDRPDLNEIRRRIKQGGHRALYVYATDRLARTPEELIAIVGEFRKFGCRTVFVKNPTDDTREGRLLLFVLGWSSENEWAQIQDRTRRGFAKLKEAGLWHGKGSVRYGYTWDKRTRFRGPDPDSAAVVVRIFRLVAHEGKSLKAICSILNAEGVPTPRMVRAIRKGADVVPYRWTPGVVHKIISEPTYKGFRVEDRTIRTDVKKGSRFVNAPAPKGDWSMVRDPNVVALVDDETWDVAQVEVAVKRKDGAAETRNSKIPFLFRGLAFCGDCGKPMVCQNVKRKPSNSHYKCSSYDAAWFRDEVAPHGFFSIRQSILESLAWELVVRVVSAPGVIEEQSRRVLADDGDVLIQSELETTLAQVAEARRGVANLTMSLATAANEFALHSIQDGLNEAAILAERMESHAAKLRLRLRPYANKEAIVGRIKQLADAARMRIASGEEIDFDQKRELMESLGVTILVHQSREILVKVAAGSHEMARLAGDEKVIVECPTRSYLTRNYDEPVAFVIGLADLGSA